MQTRWFAVALLAATGLGVPAAWAYTPEQLCQVAKVKAARKYTVCRIKAEEKFIKIPDASVRTSALAKCDAKFAAPTTGGWSKADIKYGLNACPGAGAVDSVKWFQTALTDTTDRLVASLGGASTPRGGPLPYCQLPATGQTTSAHDGDDGDMQAGSTLPFVYSGDLLQAGSGVSLPHELEAIVDQRTGLMWEIKINRNGPGEDAIDPRDVDNMYCWDPTDCPGDSIWDHIDRLNNTCFGAGLVAPCATDAECGTAGVCGYAGYRDWRIPNVTELHSILDYSIPDLAVPFIFYDNPTGCSTGCTSCSCTGTGADFSGSDSYWSSTQRSGIEAWIVSFRVPFVIPQEMETLYPVRAVRGGS